MPGNTMHGPQPNPGHYKRPRQSNQDKTFTLACFMPESKGLVYEFSLFAEGKKQLPAYKEGDAAPFMRESIMGEPGKKCYLNGDSRLSCSFFS